MNETIYTNQNTFVDVRTSVEFNSGHFPGAINIPLDQIPKRWEEIKNAKTPIIVYCLSGGRSEQAMRFLQEKGINDIINGGAYQQVLINFKK